MTRLTLVRHGETDWNRDGKLQGQIDIDLNDTGRLQAERLGRRLADNDFTAVYSSDLRRCWDTATIALRGRAIAPTPRQELREIALGHWEGLTTEEVVASMPDEIAHVRADPIERAPKGGESRRQLQARIVAAIQDIVAVHPGESVLIVSHGGSLRALALWALWADLRASPRIDFDNCAVSVMEFDGLRPAIRFWNDTAHLNGLPSHERAATPARSLMDAAPRRG